MEPSHYITPRLGLRTAIVVAGWIGAVYLLDRNLPEPEIIDGGIRSFVGPMLQLGSFYGVIAWVFWLLTVVPGTLLRSLLRLMTLLAGSYLLALIENDGISNGRSWMRFIIYLGGMMISQCGLFFLLRIPPWRLSAPPDEVQDGQFSIAEVLIGTTGIALLLGLAIRFQTPINAHEYWSVLMGLWILFPMISAGACLAALHRTITQSVLRLTISLVLAFSGAVGLAYFEIAFGDLPARLRTLFVVLYGTVGMGNMIMMFVLPFAGRFDARNVPRDSSQDTSVN